MQLKGLILLALLACTLAPAFAADDPNAIVHPAVESVVPEASGIGPTPSPVGNVIQKTETKAAQPKEDLGLLARGAVVQVKFLNDTDGGRFSNGMRVPIFPAIHPNESVVLRYKVNIPSGFKLGVGGTLPGLMGGGDECPQEAAGAACWSVQLAWQPNGSGRVIAHIPRAEQSPVLQLPNTTLGDGNAVAIRGVDFDWKLDSWNWVKLRVQLNTPGKQDGVLRVEVNKKEVVRILGIVYRTTPDLGIDAALMEAAHSGPVPRSPGGVAQYVLIRTVELYNAARASVPGVFQAMGATGQAQTVAADVAKTEAVTQSVVGTAGVKDTEFVVAKGESAVAAAGVKDTEFVVAKGEGAARNRRLFWKGSL